ncbi:MAG: glycoside hydrolase family 3 N-terminal domain-containing protein, partial [Anaerolineales bacterium]
GQLFLITFNGVDTSAASPVFDYITNHHIGGVILDRDNDNFQNPDEILHDCWALIQELQTVEYSSSTEENEAGAANSGQGSAYIPLFIGMSQEGDYSQYSEILSGLSPIPSQMSLGATWDPALAEQIGVQVGRELSSLGVNLLFGPSLDVISNPNPGQSDLGVRSFGGDPFWVGKFGQAYIRGLHTGSLDNIAVVAKYFPGLGSSDRLPEQEVATVRKSLDQLKQTDLAPFFAVTGNAPSPEASADALLNSHIRYQGLQGNIRSTTRPISLDPQAFELLMGLEAFSTWRDEGGIIISDNLGSQALQNFYDPTGQTFNIRRVAVDAFIAGNDILYLGNFGSENKPIPNHEIVSTLEFFAQKYKEDQDFATRVDRSVLRILTLKYSIYPTFSLAAVLPAENTLSAIGSSDTAEVVARQSATLVNPDITELDSVLQPSPSYADRIVILTDTQSTTVCSTCPTVATLATNTLEDAIIRLYGPYTGRALFRSNITSYSFKDLTTLLDFPEETEQMVNDLYNSNWIIVAALDKSDRRPYSSALTRLLAERQDLLRGKKIIVFALGAPYYLDATNISKISALFALYNHFPASIDVAARILFNEFPTFPGSLPVSVPGINYDLISATSPDPSLEFMIYAGDSPNFEIATLTPGATPTVPVFRVDDQVELRTSVILDHNGNPVPDGTPVTFYVTSQGATIALPQVTTVDGFASTSFFIENGTAKSVYAESSRARSQTIAVSVLGDSSSQQTETSPESPLQESPTAPEESQSVQPTQQEAPPTNLDEPQSLWGEWWLSVLLVLGIGFGAYRTGATAGLVRWGIRWGLAAVITGLTVYNYLLLHLPGVDLLFPQGLSLSGVGLSVLFGSLFGWLAAFLFHRFFRS